MKHPKHIQEIIDRLSNTEEVKIMALKNQIEVNKLREKAIDELRRNLR